MKTFRKRNAFVVDESGAIIIYADRTLSGSCGGLSQDEINRAFEVFDCKIDLPAGWAVDDDGDYLHEKTGAYVRPIIGHVNNVEYGNAPTNVIREACDIADQILVQNENEDG